MTKPNHMIRALQAADYFCRTADRERALHWLHIAAKYSWRYCPSANAHIAQAIWQLETEGPKPRKVA